MYDVNGNELYTAYDVNGNSLSTAYDIDGNQIWTSGPATLTVMTYNVQWFTGINSQEAMQQHIIDEYDADIIGLQEVTTNGSVPSVGSAVLSNYNVTLSNHKNYIALAAKFALSNLVVADYVNQDPKDINQWNETRAYMMCEFLANGDTITWINTHLCTTAEYRALQMAEIYALVSGKDHVIITGDFNTYNYSSTTDSEYTGSYGMFIDAGFRCANHNGLNYTKTWTDATTATSLADFSEPTDDIIVSGDIDILSVAFDTTKLDYLNGNSIDHIPIIAELQIN